MKKTITTIDEYIAQYPSDIQKILKEIYDVIRNAAPGATEKISWGMPTFILHGNLVHFAAQKSHTGFYPAPSTIDYFHEDLKTYYCTKGGVQFPYDKPLPLDLIAKMVKFRVAEQLKEIQTNK